MKKKLAPEEIVANHQKYKTMCRSVLGSGLGKDLLKELKRMYCDGQLYDESDRTTVYLIGQRDLILELINSVEDGEPTK